MRHDVAQKRHELLRGVPRRGLAEYVTCLRIERRVQRQRAVAVALEPVPFSPPRRQRQHRVVAVERLDRRLLVHAEHRRVRRRVQVQPDDVGRFLLEVRIVWRSCSAPTGAPRLQAVLAHTRATIMCDTPSFAADRRVAPVRGAIGRRLARRGRQAGRLPASSGWPASCAPNSCNSRFTVRSLTGWPTDDSSLASRAALLQVHSNAPTGSPRVTGRPTAPTRGPTSGRERSTACGPRRPVAGALRRLLHPQLAWRRVPSARRE